MKNIIEIPQNTKTAVIILRSITNDIVCAPVHGQPSELEVLTLLLGNFITALSKMENRADAENDHDDVVLLEEVRQSFRKMELEEIRSCLAEVAMSSPTF